MIVSPGYVKAKKKERKEKWKSRVLLYIMVLKITAHLDCSPGYAERGERERERERENVESIKCEPTKTAFIILLCMY